MRRIRFVCEASTEGEEDALITTERGWAVHREADQIVDLSFRLSGGLIPVDHGYAVYSAMSRLLLGLHGDDQIGIHPIYGRLIGDRKLALTQNSRLVLRLPVDRIPDVLVLAGTMLDVAGHPLRVGVPTVRALVPAAAVSSRLVVIKGFMEAEPFLDAVRRQLARLDVHGEPFLLSTGDAFEANKTRDGGTQSPWIRRTLRIRDKEVVGFAVGVERLTADESLRLQEHGIGGRRRFGCGIYVPAKG